MHITGKQGGSGTGFLRSQQKFVEFLPLALLPHRCPSVHTFNETEQ
jgi:hypothetical protein